MPENRAKLVINARNYRAKNSDKCKELGRAWEAKNKAYRNEYRKSRRKIPEVNLKESLRRAVGAHVMGEYRSARSIVLLGCSIEEFRAHLESQFKPGMSWDNYGPRGWHIDHIKPCASFDLTDPEQQKICFHYTNQRPLWWYENMAMSYDARILKKRRLSN